MSGKREVKKDCFAYDKRNNRCKALKETFCKYEECAFYKTKEELCAKCPDKEKQGACEMCRQARRCKVGETH